MYDHLAALLFPPYTRKYIHTYIHKLYIRNIKCCRFDAIKKEYNVITHIIWSVKRKTCFKKLL